jgi:hypothetical protein
MAAEPDLSGVDDKATTVLPSKTDGLRSPMQFHTKQRTLRQGSHAKSGYDAKNVSIELGSDRFQKVSLFSYYFFAQISLVTFLIQPEKVEKV